MNQCLFEPHPWKPSIPLIRSLSPEECPAGPAPEDGPPGPAAEADLGAYLRYLEGTALSDSLVHRQTLPPRPARHADGASHLGDGVARVLAAAGIERLWSHQEEGIGHLQAGRNVVVATPTASGKTLVYNAAVLADLLGQPSGFAIYVFPLKALAHDQLDELRSLLANMACGLTAEIYDGDTKRHVRDRIRRHPPNILITTPDMLHAGLLAFHEAWEEVWRNLRWVVVDELHTYNGIFGSHVLHLFRRLHRLCAACGAEPRYVTCSATIGNPRPLAEGLFGRPFTAVTRSGAPAAARHFLIADPAESPNTAAARLLQSAVERRLRSIVFTRARVATELIYRWATQHRRGLRDLISSYRAGYLPEERRQIEARLISGELLGVVSTSALELGIDIGGLDRLRPRRLPRVDRRHLAARRPRRPPGPRVHRRPAGRPRRPRSVLRQASGAVLRPRHRGRRGRPLEPLHPRAAPALRRPRAAPDPRRARVRGGPRVRAGPGAAGRARGAAAERRRRRLVRLPETAPPAGEHARHRRELVDRRRRDGPAAPRA